MAAKRPDQFTGEAGQFAVMSELLWRGYNVSVPVIDLGDDIIVMDDQTNARSRVQVKTARAQERKWGVRYQFRISDAAISDESQTPDVFFIFAMRENEQWQYIILSRVDLCYYLRDCNLGTRQIAKGRRPYTILTFHRRNGTYGCGSENLQKHVGDWSPWPIQPGRAEYE